MLAVHKNLFFQRIALQYVYILNQPVKDNWISREGSYVSEPMLMWQEDHGCDDCARAEEGGGMPVDQIFSLTLKRA